MEDTDRSLQAWLAEYGSIRTELQGRSDRQWVLVQVYAAAALALIGFCASDLSNRWGILFSIPVAALATSLLFRDHASLISGLVEYEQGILRPKIQELTREPDTLGWEDFKALKWSVFPLIRFRIGILLFIIGPVAAAAFAALAVQKTPAWTYVAWLLVTLPLVDFVLWCVRGSVASLSRLLPWSKRTT